MLKVDILYQDASGQLRCPQGLARTRRHLSVKRIVCSVFSWNSSLFRKPMTRLAAAWGSESLPGRASQDVKLPEGSRAEEEEGSLQKSQCAFPVGQWDTVLSWHLSQGHSTPASSPWPGCKHGGARWWPSLAQPPQGEKPTHPRWGQEHGDPPPDGVPLG